jgi:hypothetical protein
MVALYQASTAPLRVDPPAAQAMSSSLFGSFFRKNTLLP